MATIADFIPWVEVSAEGAPRPLVEQAIRRSIDRLLRYSGLWQVQHAAVQLVDAQASYTLTPPTGGLLLRVSALHYRGVPQSPAHAGWGVQYTGGGAATYAYWCPSTTQNTVALAPTPSGTFTSDDTITLLGVYTATLTAATFPDFLNTDYQQGVVDGALAMLLAIPGKGWTDPAEAKNRDKAFMAHAGAARVRAATGNTVGVLPVAHQHFA